MFALGLDGFVEFSPGVREAAEVGQVVGGHHGVDTVVAVGLQGALEPIQQTQGYGLTATRIVVVQQDRLFGWTAALELQIGC